MGFFSGVGSRIREYFRKDKDKAAIAFSSGATGNASGSGYDVLSQFGYEVMADYLRLEHDLLSRFVDYEEMDDYPELATAIDIFADDATQPETQLNRTCWVESSDANIQRLLDRDLFQRRLRMDEDIWEIARTIVKYGNDFEELLVTNEGVIGLNFLPPPTVRRIEGLRGELFGFVQDFKGRFGYTPAEFDQILAQRSAASGDVVGDDPLDVVALEDWEVVHFRLRGKHRRSLYGYAVLEPGRWIWKRLMMLEDAALLYRLQRAPERFAFYVDVGDLPPAEAFAMLNKVRQMHKKKKFFNPTTGKLDLKWEPLSQDDDFYIPVRKGTEGARVDVLGAPSWQSMEDVEYFRDKLFSAIKVPKAYLSQEENISRAVLSSEDVRFARTVLRVQRELRNGLGKVCRTHLAALNIDPYAVDYDVRMTVPSSIFELAQLEVRSARADLAGKLGDFVSMHWLLSNIFGLSESEIQTVTKQREEDAIQKAMNEGKAEAMGEIAGAQVRKDTAADAAEPDFGAEDLQPEAAPVPQPASRFQMRRSSRERSRRKRVGISEQELLAGNREAEKRAGDKLDKLLKSDKRTAYNLAELKGLLYDLKGASERRLTR